MANENDPVGVTNEHAASTSEIPEENEKRDGNGKTNTVPFHKLFSFADSRDIVLMIVGAIAGVVNGSALPLMTVLLGDTIDAFGQSQNSNVVEVVSKVNTVSSALFFGEIN